jgi:hypothetical protein
MFAGTRRNARFSPTTIALSASVLLTARPGEGAHPLITEDAYTLGAGAAQLELGFEYARLEQRDVRGRASEVRFTLSYGVRENLDLLIGTPYLDTREESADGIVRGRGLSDVSLEMKWRFWEGEPAKFALKPGLTFPSGDFRRGLGTGRVDPSIFLVSTSERGAWNWNVHVGYLRNDNRVGERRDLLHLSGSVVYRPVPRLQWALDLSADSNPDKDSGTFPAVALGAVIYSPTETVDLDLGVKAGLNSAADDYGVLTGVTFNW